MASNNPSETGNAKYSIKAVAALTGLPASTIRTWERRYAVVSPERTDGGDRRYSQHDLDRLLLIRALVQAGEAIRDVAGLTQAQLRERAGLHGITRRGAARRPLEAPPRLAVLHHSLAALGEEEDELDIVFAAGTRQEFEEGADPSVGSDVLLVELELVEGASPALLHSMARRVGARVLWVTHHFASSTLLDALAESGATLMRSPVKLTALRRQLRSIGEAKVWRSESPVPNDGLAAPRTYTDLQLARLQELDPKLECECPTHVASVVAQLVAFERYSMRCHNDSAEDRRLHERLALGTAKVRAQMEGLLREVLEYDGIDI